MSEQLSPTAREAMDFLRKTTAPGGPLEEAHRDLTSLEQRGAFVGSGTTTVVDLDSRRLGKKHDEKELSKAA